MDVITVFWDVVDGNDLLHKVDAVEHIPTTTLAEAAAPLLDHVPSLLAQRRSAPATPLQSPKSNSSITCLAPPAITAVAIYDKGSHKYALDVTKTLDELSEDGSLFLTLDVSGPKKGSTSPRRSAPNSTRSHATHTTATGGETSDKPLTPAGTVARLSLSHVQHVSGPSSSSTRSTSTRNLCCGNFAPNVYNPYRCRNCFSLLTNVNIPELLQGLPQPTSYKERLREILAVYPVGSTRQVNAVFLGEYGNGKSALLNSLHRTATGQSGLASSALCEEGRTGESTTLSYQLCTALHHVLPLTLFDTKGCTSGRDMGKWSAMMGQIMDGKLKVTEDYAPSMVEQRWLDVSMFNNKNTQVDVAVFVHQIGSEPFPHEFARLVAEQAEKRNISVVPVMTFYDLVAKDGANCSVEDEERSRELLRNHFPKYPAIPVANIIPLETAQDVAQDIRARELNEQKKMFVDLMQQIIEAGRAHQRAMNFDLHRKIDYRARKGLPVQCVTM